MKRRFSLIELLVVIGIIALLAAITAPALLRSRAKARETQCIGNVRQVALTVELYGNDSGCYPPTWQKGESDAVRWMELLGTLYRLPEAIFACPAKTGAGSVPGALQTAYGVNNFNFSGSKAHCFWYPVKREALRRPAEVLYLAEALDGYYYVGGGADWVPDWEHQVPKVAYRHQGKFIAMFADGHVMPLNQTPQEMWDAAR